MTGYRYTAPRPYRMAHPQMAHRVTPEPLPEPRRYDLVAIAVILLAVLAASLVGVSLVDWRDVLAGVLIFLMVLAAPLVYR